MGSALAVTTKQSWQITPSSLEEAMQYAKLIADSDIVPRDFKGKPGNVLIAIQMGDEVGLKPMQALQSIAVINGRPSIWGDAIPGLCQTSPAYEWHKEYYDETKDAAVCIVKRKNAPEHTYTFSMKDVVSGGYDKKPGPWQTERRRMMQMRARRAFRDQFPDALKGLNIAEDMLDIPAEHVQATVINTPKTSQIDSLKDKLKGAPEPTIEGEIVDEPKPITTAQWNEIKKSLAEHTIDPKELLAEFQITKGSELRDSQIDEVNKWINEVVNKRNNQ